MPTPADSLTADSTEEQVRQAVSETVAQLVKEGMSQDQAVAVAFAMARKATGRELAPSRPKGQSQP